MWGFLAQLCGAVDPKRCGLGGSAALLVLQFVVQSFRLTSTDLYIQKPWYEAEIPRAANQIIHLVASVDFIGFSALR